jgi:hypothetical protein
MSKFLTDLDVLCIDDGAWCLDAPLAFESDILGVIEVPRGFETDFASVPRIPVFYMLFGDRAHREAVLHDFLFRIDCKPPASYSQANRVFLEAMEERGKPFYVRWAMYMGVVLGGWTAYQKKRVMDRLSPKG